MDRIAKAVMAALIAGLAVFDFATTGGSAGGEAVVSAEWVRITVSTVVAGLGVWAVPNEPKRLS